MAHIDTLHHDQLVPAIQQNLNSAILSLKSRQINTQSSPSVTQAWSTVAFPIFNMVAHANVTNGTTIADILQPYRTNRAPAVWFRLPQSQPEDLDHQLLATELTLTDVRPCMAGEIDKIPNQENGANIIQVQEENQCRDWVQVQSLSNGGFPPVVQEVYVDLMRASLNEDSSTKAFVAYENEQAAACSLLHLAAGVAGIYQVGTIPDARRKGYGTAITHAPLRYAAQRGYKISVLIATKMGKPVYQKMGFEKIFPANIYLFAPQ